MKKQTFLFLLMVVSLQAQDQKQKIKETIQSFFEAFHKQDSLQMKSLVYGDIRLHSTGRDKNGDLSFTNIPVGEFYKSIVGIPKEVQFEERLTQWDIRIDGNMATAWVGYQFFVNDILSHFGTNCFQLVQLKEDWKIVYIMDTREKPKEP